MSQIIINEISDNYTYNIGNSSYATVAMPMTSCWGPGFFDPNMISEDDSDPACVGDSGSLEYKIEAQLENTSWKRYPATRDGIESFVSDYRGPAAGYRLAKDYSYYMAITLMTAGYDVLVCRLCPGKQACTDQFEIYDKDGAEVNTDKEHPVATFQVRAKYPGTFGNQLLVSMYKPVNRNYWNLVTYVMDAGGVKSAVENVAFVLDPSNATDNVPYVGEVDSQFVEIITEGNLKDEWTFKVAVDNPSFDSTKDESGTNAKLLHVDVKGGVSFSGGTDRSAITGSDDAAKVKDAIDKSSELAKVRFKDYIDNVESYDAAALKAKIDSLQYVKQLAADATALKDVEKAESILYREWIFRYALRVYDLLKDKLAYNPNRIIAPGWDDLDIEFLGGKYTHEAGCSVLDVISPIHGKLMECAYYSRCATAYLDVPRNLARRHVYTNPESTQPEREKGYAQMLESYHPVNELLDINANLYSTHSALFAPWGQYKYVGTGKYCPAPPSFLTILMQRSMVLNQSTQYEWIQPSDRTHSVKVAKLDYAVPKKVLDLWQPTDEEGGIGVNAVTSIPGMGIIPWGNYTLFNNPVMSYQALRNLSTRHLVCAIEDAAYKAGLRITYRYNNSEAYSTFHAGVASLLDTMRNVGAIEDYYVTMNHDLDSLGIVKANSVVGKIYIVPYGIVDKITVDLIALPPGSDLTPYMG